MKAVSVIASPRKNGNCSQIVNYISEGLKEKDVTNQIYFIDDLNINTCKACKTCKNMEIPTKCVIKDDFLKIMDEIEESDIFIFAAPNYFGEINAQGHLFINRFYSMTKTTLNQLKNNPKCVIIHTYGASDGHYDEYIRKRSRVFESIGCNLVEILSIGKNKPNSGNCESLIEYTKELGRKLGEKLE
ncbi:MAG: flavodoxin family protein [Methanosphaera stadtmanae]|nr:flavodoxin family protein [Methanosphaera stadtmanae]